MTLQWTLVATFLYIEVAFMIILLLPFISPTRWQKIFRSRIVTALTSYASLYFNVILVALVLLLLDAIREISKYKTRLHTSNDPQHGSLHYGPTMELVKEFRAQRNFYISGTALFLWFVIKRLLALITNTARLIAENQAIKSQAEAANRAAMEGVSQKVDDAKKQSGKDDTAQKEKLSDEYFKVLKIKEEEIETLKKGMNKAKLDLDTMRKQSESVSREYDNLLKEHAKLEIKLSQAGVGSGGSGDKKSN